RGARRGAGADHGPGLRAQDLPGVFRRAFEDRAPLMENALVITIDGPSASGKGTVAYLVSKGVGFHYLDSGALYRLVALAAAYAPAPLDDEPAIAQIAKSMRVRFEGEDAYLEDQLVSDDIRSEDCARDASKVAAMPTVRNALLGRQRAFRQPPGLVAEGRDMGTVVFPDAALKVFLTASLEERARRRHKQLIDKGIHATLRTLF